MRTIKHLFVGRDALLNINKNVLNHLESLRFPEIYPLEMHESLALGGFHRIILLPY